jgi:hypothetical protein
VGVIVNLGRVVNNFFVVRKIYLEIGYRSMSLYIFHIFLESDLILNNNFSCFNIIK